MKQQNNKMTKKELVKLFVSLCKDEDGVVNLSGLDFTNEKIKGVNTSFMKVNGHLYQGYQEVEGSLYQNSQKVERTLWQGNQEVNGSLHQNSQKVKGNLWQDNQKVKGNLTQNKAN